MASPAKRRRDRLARQRRFFQDQAEGRKIARDRAYKSSQEERRRMGFGIDIVTSVPDGLRDVTRRSPLLSNGDG